MRSSRFRTQPLALSVVAAAAIGLVAASPRVSGAQEDDKPGGAQRLDPPLGPVTKFVNRERIRELTQKLVRINSEYEYPDVLNHKEIAAVLAAELKSIGMQVEVVGGDPNFPVVVGRLKGTSGKPSLGFATHYNTVMVGNRSKWTVDPFAAVYKDGKIYGRGSSNSKGGLAADIEAVRAVKESGVKLKGDLVIVSMPGEGGTEFAMPWVLKNRPELIKADYYLEGGSGGDFTRMQAGHVWFKLVVNGTQTHPPCHAPCVNAVEKLLKVLPAVVKVDDWLTWKSEPTFVNRKPSADVTKIVAGYDVNIVPDRAEADIDMRLIPTMTQKQIEAELMALLARLKKEDPALDVDVQWTWKSIIPYESWFTVTDDDPLVKTIREIAPAYTGKVPGWSKSLGGGAGRPDLWELGSKVVYFGVGGAGANAHGIDEWVGVDGLARAARFRAELAARFLQ
jgi:succinyl-diaminopimelate desuccinylase